MNDQPSSPTAPNPNPLRTIAWTMAGICAGIVVALALLFAVEVASAVVHPFPPDFAGTQEAMCAHVALYPQWVLAAVVPAWAFTAFAATWIARRLGALPGAIPIGLLLTAGVLFNVAMLPYPIWFKIVSPIAVIVAVIAASRSRCCSATLG